VFEERYRALVRDLLAGPAGAARRFGVVAIRRGREAGAAGVPELHEVGCTAELQRVQPHADGRYDLLTTGGVRFRVRGVATDRPYLVADVELLPEPAGAGAAVVAAAVRSAYEGYADALAELGVGVREPRALPADPVGLSHAVAGAMVLDLAERQALLAAPDAARRLAAERSLIRRETALLRRLSALPGSELLRTVPITPN
jgi:Lon protease-like protein